jgi:hypothetical protein
MPDDVKRPLERLIDRGFLAEPRPEEFVKISMAQDLQGPVFTVGVKIIKDDGWGLKITPTAQIVFAIDEVEIDLPSSMTRDLIPRLQEMCALRKN